MNAPPRLNERRNARQKALQAVYQWDMTDESMRLVEREFCAHQDMQRVDMAFFSELLRAVETACGPIDQQLQPCLGGRPVADLDPIERSVCRLGCHELMQRQDIPLKVVISEWVMLAKRFGADQGHTFVNGVLDCVARDARALELQSLVPNSGDPKP